MADKLIWPLPGANEREVVLLLAKVTGAADVQVNGYTINYGNGVASVARTAEGVITITLRDQYHALLGLDYDISLDDFSVTLDSETVASTKTIVLTCRYGTETAANADKDPDSAVIGLRIWLKNAAAD